MLGYYDFDVVAGIGRKDEVDIFQTDIDTGGKDLLHLAFKDEMPFVVALALVKQDASLVDEVFVGEESHQGVGLVAPSCDGYALCACRDDEQG